MNALQGFYSWDKRKTVVADDRRVGGGSDPPIVSGIAKTEIWKDDPTSGGSVFAEMNTDTSADADDGPTGDFDARSQLLVVSRIPFLAVSSEGRLWFYDRWSTVTPVTHFVKTWIYLGRNANT